MNTSFKKGSSLILLVSFLINAQVDYNISQNDSTFSDISMNLTMNKNSDDSQYNVGKFGDLAEMPILNPEVNAAMKIYHPPKNIVYNMPFIGKQDTSQVNFDFK